MVAQLELRRRGLRVHCAIWKVQAAHTTATSTTTATTTRAAAAATVQVELSTRLEVVGLHRVLDEVCEAALSDEAFSLSVRCLCLELSNALPKDSELLAQSRDCDSVPLIESAH